MKILLFIAVLSMTGCAHSWVTRWHGNAYEISCNRWCDEEDWQEAAVSMCPNGKVVATGGYLADRTVASTNAYQGNTSLQTYTQAYRTYRCEK